MPLNRKQDNVILLYIDHFIHLVLISNAVETATNINQKYGNVNIVYFFGSKRFAVKQCEQRNFYVYRGHLATSSFFLSYPFHDLNSFASFSLSFGTITIQTIPMNV